jgi:hypothetical protein
MTAPVDVVDRHRPTVFEVSGDTCDRCGPAVAAFVYVVTRTGPLSYCGHCGTRFWDALNEQAVAVIDCRHLITA